MIGHIGGSRVYGAQSQGTGAEVRICVCIGKRVKCRAEGCVAGAGGCLHNGSYCRTFNAEL